jgi:hypothetical protein
MYEVWLKTAYLGGIMRNLEVVGERKRRPRRNGGRTVFRTGLSLLEKRSNGRRPTWQSANDARLKSRCNCCSPRSADRFPVPGTARFSASAGLSRIERGVDDLTPRLSADRCMSCPVLQKAGTTSREAQLRNGGYLIRPIARSLERAPRNLVLFC